MKKFTIIVLITSVFTVSCGSIAYIRNILKARISTQEAVDMKGKMDQSQNPAYRHEILKELQKKRIRLEDVVVKDVIDSGNIDYTFCVIVSVPTDKGQVECYIYAGDIFPKEDISTIAKLEKGKTRINVDGDFSRFFTLLDETYTKIEIVNAIISIR